MRYLLDTNVCIAAMRGNPEVCHRLQAEDPNDCGVSSITVYELFAGVERCRRPATERRKVEALLAPIHLLPFDYPAAVAAARLRWSLERAGNLIGPHDLMIAAQAVALDVVLVTRNTREFRRVEGLRWENWQIDP